MGILGELWVKLGLRNEALNKGLDDSKKKVSGFANYMSKLGGIMAAAFSVKEIVAFTHQTAELANKAAGVKKAFDKLNSPGLLSDLRRATMGTVDDLQLMQRAVQANNFKIPLDQLAKYFEFATAQAASTGMSVDYLVDSIILGLGRRSLPILDNLGFSAAEIRDRMKEGGSMADAVGKIIEERMASGALAIDEATQATQRLATAWTNFQLAFGESSKGPWNWIKNQVSGILEETTGILNSNNLTGLEKFLALNPLTGGFMRAIGVVGSALKQDAEEAAEAIKKLKKETEDYNKLIESGEFIGPMMKGETVAVKGLIERLNEEIEAKEKLKNLSANEDEIRQLNDEIAAMKERLKILQMSTEEYKKYRNEQMKPIPEMNNSLGNIFDKDYIAERGASAMDAINTHYQNYITSLEAQREKMVEQQAMLDQMNEHFNNSIVAGISGGIEQLVRAMMGVEDADLGTVVQALLTPMADALMSAGEMIMAEGIAVEAFKKSLTSLQGAPAIAAGAAMVAIASAVKAGLQAIGNNPTSAGGYGASSVTSYSGGYGVNTANYSQSANDYNLVATLKGQDLLLAIQRTENNNRR